MDPLLVLVLLAMICMASMVPMMLFGSRHHRMGFCSDRRSRLGGSPETGREILDRRYASGEITKDRYEEMRAELDRGAPSEI